MSQNFTHAWHVPVLSDAMKYTEDPGGSVSNRQIDRKEVKREEEILLIRRSHCATSTHCGNALGVYSLAFTNTCKISTMTTI